MDESEGIEFFHSCKARSTLGRRLTHGLCVAQSSVEREKNSDRNEQNWSDSGSGSFVL